MSVDTFRILVTGADGFVARHLVPWFQAHGAEVIGTVLRPGTGRPGTTTIPLDITDAERTRGVVRDVRPTHIVHLAAITSVRDSFANPSQTEDVNVLGTQHLLDAAGGCVPAPRTLLIGSGEEYGQNKGIALSELPVSALHPVSPYGMSKKKIEEIVERSPALRAFVIRTRSFPQIGVGHAGHFFIPEVVRQIVHIERGEQSPEIGVGNLDAIRDFTDVRDVVRAYWLLLERGVPGDVYNVCSGVGRGIRDVLTELLAIASVHVEVRPDPAKARPADIPVLIGDNRKLREATGWTPVIPFRQTLADVLADARSRTS